MGDPVPTPARVLAVFAHPDDEVFCAGGTMAKWAAEGAEIVVVSATPGDAGQIRDATTAVRRTLGQVREEELRRACALLGVRQVVVFGYGDGTLQDVSETELIARVRTLLDEVDPDVVITFGEDGAYGHPDHVAIGEATAAAVRQRWSDDGAGIGRPSLLRSHFPRSTISLAERLAAWLVSMEGRFDGSADYGRALTLFAEESTTMRFATDDVRVVWYPHGTMIVEQGEPATSLCLILSGAVEVIDEGGTSPRILRTLGEGKFFGELGVAHGHARSASVVAVGNVTCLVLSPTKRTKYEGRGGTAQRYASDDGSHPASASGDGATISIDITDHVDKKLAALALHRSQYPIDVNAFPHSMLEEMFGIEHFTPVLPG